MFVRRAEFMELVNVLGRAQGALSDKNAQIAAMQTTLDWLTVRVTQLEKERARLLYNYMGIKVETPEIIKKSERQAEEDVRNMLHSVPHFADMGDEEARRQNVTWNPDGTIATAADK